jgi:pyridoxine kinase
MPLALILSSYVAAARIGGGAQQYALAALGVDPVLVPTVLLGRSPARGARGRSVEAALFAALLADIEADGLLGRFDLVITGHFSRARQVELAAETIRKARAANPGPGPIVVVDPILGDEPKGLYVLPEVAAAVVEHLVPLADWITPNVWELSYLTGETLAAPDEVLHAVRSLGRPALVTSLAAGPQEIGLLYCDLESAALFAHPRLEGVPHGGGDLVTAIFGAGLAQGMAPPGAAERAASAVAEACTAAVELGLSDLPLVALGERLARPTAELRVAVLS